MAGNQLVKYMTDHGEVQLSKDIVKQYLVSGDADKVTDQEVTMFLNLCQYQGLNPFLREAYLIKFGSSPATIVVGKEVFTKRASGIELCKGWEAGVIVKSGKGLEYRAGSMVLEDETLVGGWAKVHRSNWDQPIEITASLKEYIRYKNDGAPNRQWASMPATMIRKVALVQALREAFPDRFQGMYSQEEMPVDESQLNTTTIIDVSNESETSGKQSGGSTSTHSPQSGAQSGTRRPLSEAQVKRFYAIANQSQAGESVIKSILENRFPDRFTADGKFDWNRISREEYDTLCSMFQDGSWQSEFNRIMNDETEVGDIPTQVNPDDIPGFNGQNDLFGTGGERL